MTRAQAEAAIRDGDAALARCEAQRRLLIEAWPQSLEAKGAAND